MFSWIADTIEGLGYWGIAGLTLLENIVLPLPSEVIVPMAGYVTTRGHLDFWLVVVAASAGCVGGAGGWYGVARSIGGRRLCAWSSAHGHWVTMACAEIDKGQDWFGHHGKWAVLLGRMVPAVRTIVSVP